MSATGCDEETVVAQPQPPPPLVQSAKPVDEVEPGELAAGTESAFGIPFPRKMQVRSRFSSQVTATGYVMFEQASNYIRDHVEAKHVDTGPGQTVFMDATVKGGDPKVLLRISVSKVGTGGTRIIIEEITPAEVPEEYKTMTDRERWKRVGLTPDGKPANPNTFE